MPLFSCFDEASYLPLYEREELPLHDALRARNINPNVALSLLGAYPHAAVIFDDDGNLPLHLAVSNGATKKM